MLTMPSFAVSIIGSIAIAFLALSATSMCLGKKKRDENAKKRANSNDQKPSGVPCATATSARITQIQNNVVQLDNTQSASVKSKPKMRIPALKPIPEKKANSGSQKSMGKSKRKDNLQVSNDKSTEREEKIDAGDSEMQEVVPEHLVKVMGDLDEVVNRAELEKEIEAMKSVHELEDEVPQGKMRADDVQIAQDNCKLFQTNTKAYNKEKEKKKTNLATKKEGKPTAESPPKIEDSSLSYRPNF